MTIQGGTNLAITHLLSVSVIRPENIGMYSQPPVSSQNNVGLVITDLVFMFQFQLGVLAPPRGVTKVLAALKNLGAKHVVCIYYIFIFKNTIALLNYILYDLLRS